MRLREFQRLTPGSFVLIPLEFNAYRVARVVSVGKDSAVVRDWVRKTQRRYYYKELRKWA